MYMYKVYVQSILDDEGRFQHLMSALTLPTYVVVKCAHSIFKKNLGFCKMFCPYMK